MVTGRKERRRGDFSPRRFVPYVYGNVTVSVEDLGVELIELTQRPVTIFQCRSPDCDIMLSENPD
jgi:hypothetical protein